MAGEVLAQINPADLFRETSVGYVLAYQSGLYGGVQGQSRGLSLQKIPRDLIPVPSFIQAAQPKEYYNGQWIVPAAVALATGLTFRFMLCDDGTDPADLGKVVQLEVTPFNLSTAAAPADWSLAASQGTATTGNVTLSATSGAIVIGSIAIVLANLRALAAGNVFGMRLRRVGDAVADTCNGRALLLGGVITNT